MLLPNIILVELLNKKIKNLPILTCETLKYLNKVNFKYYQ